VTWKASVSLHARTHLDTTSSTTLKNAWSPRVLPGICLLPPLPPSCRTNGGARGVVTVRDSRPAVVGASEPLPASAAVGVPGALPQPPLPLHVSKRAPLPLSARCAAPAQRFGSRRRGTAGGRGAPCAGFLLVPGLAPVTSAAAAAAASAALLLPRVIDEQAPAAAVHPLTPAARAM
jgi:hypothetical protein